MKTHYYNIFQELLSQFTKNKKNKITKYSTNFINFLYQMLYI